MVEASYSTSGERGDKENPDDHQKSGIYILDNQKKFKSIID